MYNLWNDKELFDNNITQPNDKLNSYSSPSINTNGSIKTNSNAVNGTNGNAVNGSIVNAANGIVRTNGTQINDEWAADIPRIPGEYAVGGEIGQVVMVPRLSGEGPDRRGVIISRKLAETMPGEEFRIILTPKGEKLVWLRDKVEKEQINCDKYNVGNILRVPDQNGKGTMIVKIVPDSFEFDQPAEYIKLETECGPKLAIRVSDIPPPTEPTTAAPIEPTTEPTVAPTEPTMAPTGVIEGIELGMINFFDNPWTYLQSHRYDALGMMTIMLLVGALIASIYRVPWCYVSQMQSSYCNAAILFFLGVIILILAWHGRQKRDPAHQEIETWQFWSLVVGGAFLVIAILWIAAKRSGVRTYGGFGAYGGVPGGMGYGGYGY